METNTEINTELVNDTQEPQTSEAATQTPEEQMGHLKQMTEFQFQVYAEIVKAHVSSLTKVMISSNGVTQLQKLQAQQALFEAINYALYYGTGLKMPKLRDKGVIFAKEANNVSGNLAQARDQRMLLVALNKKEQDEAALQAEAQATENQETNSQEEVNNG